MDALGVWRRTQHACVIVATAALLYQEAHTVPGTTAGSLHMLPEGTHTMALPGRYLWLEGLRSPRGQVAEPGPKSLLSDPIMPLGFLLKQIQGGEDSCPRFSTALLSEVSVGCPQPQLQSRLSFL